MHTRCIFAVVEGVKKSELSQRENEGLSRKGFSPPLSSPSLSSLLGYYSRAHSASRITSHSFSSNVAWAHAYRRLYEGYSSAVGTVPPFPPLSGLAAECLYRSAPGKAKHSE